MTTIYPGQSVTFGIGGLMSSGVGHRGGDGWRPMGEAPRDGTIIEVRCTYGVAPWYGLYHWLDDGSFGSRWAKVGDEMSGFTEDGTFSWRPYAGSAEAYSDPTGGAQDTSDYWIRACGMNPRDYPNRPNPERRKPLLQRVSEALGIARCQKETPCNTT